MNKIINVNKPSGMSSHQAVSRVKRILGAKKAGHTGTLDPLATGVLLICLNEATKISRFLLDMDKGYRARVKLGVRTDTGDAEGKITEEKDFSFVTADDIAGVAGTFSGRIWQRPPMYSALKINGEKLYKLARKGIDVEREERAVEIYDIRVSDVALPFFDLTVSCSKGTYIRTLSEDIGLKLGTAAHLVALERTRIGFFDIRDSVSLEDISPEGHAGGGRHVCSIDSALRDLGEIILEATDYDKARRGMAVQSDKFDNLGKHSHVRLKDPSGKIFGIGRRDSNMVRVERLFNL